MLWIIILIASVAIHANSRPINRSVGNSSLPVPVCESFRGWECYEEIYASAKMLTVHACAESPDYSVPCFKWNGTTMSFNLKNEDSMKAILEASGSRQLSDEMIRCYLKAVKSCEDGGRMEILETSGCDLEGQSKFHIAMLSISLIIAIPLAAVFSYFSTASEDTLLIHIRNVILALLARTFFSLLIETQVISVMMQSGDEEPMENWFGCVLLSSLHVIAANLVVAFFLIISCWLYASVTCMGLVQPKLRKAYLFVFGLAVIFPIIWIIIMAAGNYKNCWLEGSAKWVNDSLRLCFILIHAFIVIVVAFFNAIPFTRKCVERVTRQYTRGCVFMVVVSPLFLLQFSLSASHPGLSEAHAYAEFFFDGLQCGIVAVAAVWLFIHEMEPLLNWVNWRTKSCDVVLETRANAEAEIRQGDAPPREPRSPPVPAGHRWQDDTNDVTYSSVLTPERFERTIKLYNRLNLIPKQTSQDDSSVKSEYFDAESDRTVYGDVINSDAKFYISKYLVSDSESAGSEGSAEQVDASREVQRWLTSCRSEFQDYAEKASRLKSATQQRTIRRSLSGSILTGSDIPGTIKLPIADDNCDSVQSRRGSAPCLVEEETNRKSERLPRIYDDLKDYTKGQAVKRAKNKNYNEDWLCYRNRVLDKRRRVTLKEPDMSRRVDGFPVAEINFRGGTLKRNQFSNMEDLTRTGDEDDEKNGENC